MSVLELKPEQKQFLLECLERQQGWVAVRDDPAYRQYVERHYRPLKAKLSAPDYVELDEDEKPTQRGFLEFVKEDMADMGMPVQDFDFTTIKEN